MRIRHFEWQGWRSILMVFSGSEAVVTGPMPNFDHYTEHTHE